MAFHDIAFFDMPFRISYNESMRILYNAQYHPKTKGIPPLSGPALITVGEVDYGFPGYADSLLPGHSFTIGKDMIADCIAHYCEKKEALRKKVPRDTAAHIVDWDLWMLSQAGASLDLLMGDLLAELKDEKLEKLGYVKIGDYVREELGISPRAGYELIRNAVGLMKYPKVKKAYLTRVINKSSLRYLLQVIEPGLEENWVKVAAMLTARGLQEFVKRWKKAFGAQAAGEYDDDDDSKGAWNSVKMPLPTAALYDYTVEWVRRMEEAEIPESEILELLLAEYVASCPAGDKERGSDSRERDSDFGVRGSGKEEKDEAAQMCARENHTHKSCEHEGCDHHGESKTSDQLCDELALELAAAAMQEGKDFRSAWRRFEKDLAEISHCWSFLPWNPVEAKAPEALRPDPSWLASPFTIAAKLRELHEMKQIVTWHTARLLRHMRNWNLQQELMFLAITHYGRERLGMSDNTVRSLIRLAGSFRDYPVLEREYLAGRLSREKVRLLTVIFNAGSYCTEDWVEYAMTAPALELSHLVERFTRLQEINPRESHNVTPQEIRERDSDFGFRDSGKEKKEEAAQMCAQGERGSDFGVRDSGEEKKEEVAQMCAQGERDSDFGIRDSGKEEKDEAAQMCAQRERDSGDQEDGKNNRSPLDSGTPFVSRRVYVPEGLQELWDFSLGFHREQCRALQHPFQISGFVEDLLLNFISTWGDDTTVGAIHELPLHIRNRVLERDGYRCAIPGCTCRRFLEVHHIIFRSKGGGDFEWNLVTLCGFHHKKCVHQGYITIKGRAPGNLEIVLGVSAEHPPLARFRNGVRETLQQ